MAPDREQVPDDPARNAEAGLLEDAAPALDPIHADLDADPVESWSSWGDLWQVPAIVVSVLLIAAGLHLAGQRRPANDFHGALDQVDRLIAGGEFDVARRRLTEVVEPNLETATAVQTGRYHATVADWIAASQQVAGVSAADNNRVIADRYARAVEGGLALSAARIERWAEALIDLGETETARRRIAELEGLGVTDDVGSDARSRRNRLLRRLVEHSLRQEDLSFEALLGILEGYAEDQLLTPADRAWVVAREAELRLEVGAAAEAIDHLLPDMRRLEDASEEPLTPPAWGELYTLLGRAYYDQSQYEHAVYYLRRALACLEGQGAGQSEAILLLGRIDMANSDIEGAFEHFDTIVREYDATDAFLSALLGRAEAESILGRHAESLADYRTVVARLPGAAPRRDVGRRRVAESLADRHDAALTTGDLDLALEYVALAEALYDVADVPRDVIEGIASTNRQIAENMVAAALREAGDDPELIDPKVRYEAGRRYERAGDYFLRHARMLAAAPGGDDDWATSLWLCGDSYDRAGLRQRAIKHFREYVAGRPVDDEFRGEVTFRLARAHQAEEEFEAAARVYEQVIAEHPRGTFGTRSIVPLARTYLRLDRRRDAEQRLVEVVDGRPGVGSPLTPDAVDYRDALVELGKIYYDDRRTQPAIERLTLAVERYPDEPRINEIRFRLADSQRRHALGIREQLRSQPRMSPGERLRMETRANEHLEQALVGFGQVVGGYGQRTPSSLGRLERDYERLGALYRADCAFELRRYRVAAELYDQAARRYADHHSSMHALVQIVNCFDRLGETPDAEIAHQNALTRLRQLPDAAFDDPQTLMDRAAWERWLQNRPVELARGAEPTLN